MKFCLFVLLVTIIVASWWTCQTSWEAFEDVRMRPWFGYEPGRYGPGWGRKECYDTPSCTKI
jgi:hypothetical protein